MYFLFCLFLVQRPISGGRLYHTPNTLQSLPSQVSRLSQKRGYRYGFTRNLQALEIHGLDHVTCAFSVKQLFLQLIEHNQPHEGETSSRVRSQQWTA